jgi:hypothetical protein
MIFSLLSSYISFYSSESCLNTAGGFLEQNVELWRSAGVYILKHRHQRKHPLSSGEGKMAAGQHGQFVFLRHLFFSLDSIFEMRDYHILLMYSDVIRYVKPNEATCRRVQPTIKCEKR